MQTAPVQQSHYYKSAIAEVYGDEIAFLLGGNLHREPRRKWQGKVPAELGALIEVEASVDGNILAIHPVGGAVQVQQADDSVRYPAYEEKTVMVNGKAVRCIRRSGYVVSSNRTQHTNIHTSYDHDGRGHVQSTQWQTSDLRLRFADGQEDHFNLSFLATVNPGDFVSVVSFYHEKKDVGYTIAAQNHTIGKYFSTKLDGGMMARLGISRFIATLISGWTPVTLILFILYQLTSAFGFSIVGVFGAAILGGLLWGGSLIVFGTAYMIFFGRGINRRVDDILADFSPW
ncbi:hypothetical protein ACO34A_04620 [Rhizobium sp. ACO-34A]|nr:hypothetical protein [Rhizobium sp. ACO-34A]ATN33085.1 hypothetical protein ACO34A_04620 [Rhizobium sp. ACO-34A]